MQVLRPHRSTTQRTLLFFYKPAAKLRNVLGRRPQQEGRKSQAWSQPFAAAAGSGASYHFWGAQGAHHSLVRMWQGDLFFFLLPSTRHTKEGAFCCVRHAENLELASVFSPPAFLEVSYHGRLREAREDWRRGKREMRFMKWISGLSVKANTI